MQRREVSLPFQRRGNIFRTILASPNFTYICTINYLTHSTNMSTKFPYLLFAAAFLLFISLGCPRTSSTPAESLGEFDYLQDQKVLPNGQVTHINAYEPGTNKRVRVKISGISGKIISGQAQVRCEFSFNKHSSVAMNTAQSAQRLNFDPANPEPVNENNPIFFFAEIPASNLQPCQWFHYRWIVQSSNGIKVGALRSFQIGHRIDSENPPPPCPAVQ